MEAHPVGTSGQTGEDAEKQFKDYHIGLPADCWDLSFSALSLRFRNTRNVSPWLVTKTYL
jgi:hypothetical protein